MRIVSKYQKFQEGGAVGAPQDPMAQLLQVAVEAVQTQNCEAAMAVCQALIQLAQGAAGGPAPGPEGAAPEEAPAEEQPTFARYGAKLVRVKR